MILSNISVAIEADEESARQMKKKLCDKDILFSASLMGHSVLIWNLRTCGSNSTYQF